MRRRTGFTLVELLVSMALIVFIMAILAEAFVEALKTFRSMKSTGDMDARLRAATNLLKDDLAADHFEGRRRTSDPRFWDQGPPQEGYFRLWHGSGWGRTRDINPSFYLDGVHSVDATSTYIATDQSLAFTVKKRGNNPKDFFRATVPARSPLLSLGTPSSRYQEDSTATSTATYTSQWAEVAWFLRANGATTVLAGDPSITLPLYTLYRRQRVVVPSTLTTNATTGELVDLNYQWPGQAPVKADYLEISTSSRTYPTDATLFFNSPRDLTIPQRRFGMNQDVTVDTRGWGGIPKLTNGRYEYPILARGGNSIPGLDEDADEGPDVVLTDVVSFCVLPFFGGLTYSGVPESDIREMNSVSSLFPLHNAAPNIGIFDTWSSFNNKVYDYTFWNDTHNPDTLVPNNINVLLALEISIRVWDAKTNQARQITIIQDM